MRTLKKVNVKGRRALVRVDFNVPIDEKRAILDDFRIRAALPTIEALSRKNAKVILISHFGRPAGRDPRYSLDVVRDRLLEYDISVGFAPDCVGPQAEEIVNDIAPGEIVLLENLRFHEGEEANDAGFARALASLGDVYVNDAFGASHRSHASLVLVPRMLPSYAGPLLEREVEFLGALRVKPKRPLVLVLGGAKAKEKLAVLKAFISKADHILVGGIVANALFAAQGLSTGNSVLSEDVVAMARDIFVASSRLHLPVDVVVARGSAARPSAICVKAVGNVQENEYILDIGPETRKLFVNIIYGAGTIFWNGPMGLFEKEEFSHGTETIACAIAASKGVKIVGGGEAAAALMRLGLAEAVDHVSTGGGAMLDFLAGKRLPGLEALGYYN